MIEISVHKMVNGGQDRCLFCRQIPFNDSLSFPFDSLVSNLRLLFPDSTSIIFKIC